MNESTHSEYHAITSHSCTHVASTQKRNSL